MTSSIAPFLAEGQQAAARYALAAPRRAPQGTAGAQLGRLAGQSLEFMDHREYQPGDDLRRLDWAAYARTDKLVVKLYRQEVCPHLDLLVDGSRSMALAGKRRAAVALAAALATAAANAGHTHRVYLTGAGCRPVAHGAEPPAAWQGFEFDSAETPPQSFRLLPPAWRPWAVRALVSDLLWLGDPLELLTSMAERAAAVYVVQLLAAEDLDPPPRGNLRLVDSESGAAEELFVDEAAVARYRNNLQRHQDNWQQAARKVGAVLVPLVAEHLSAAWDLSPLVAARILTV